MPDLNLISHPLTPDRWGDLESLFGPKGACGGCWCMFWRLSRSDYERMKGSENRRRFKELISGGEIPGLLAYQDDKPVGWVSVGPREQFPLLERSKVLARVDEQEVWSVVCFFIDRSVRGQGVATFLLKSALDFARQRGAQVVEGYPTPTKEKKIPDAFAWTGPETVFQQLGFRLMERRGKSNRGIYRYYF
ncbi:MAG: GNAT family N-acetyltransferase [bacterium]